MNNNEMKEYARYLYNERGYSLEDAVRMAKATESFDSAAINTLSVLGAIYSFPVSLVDNLLQVPIASLSAANLKAITNDAIRSCDPDRIRKAIKVVKYRMDAIDRYTADDRMYAARQVTRAGHIYHADEIADVGERCLEKLNDALKYGKGRKSRYVEESTTEALVDDAIYGDDGIY